MTFATNGRGGLKNKSGTRSVTHSRRLTVTDRCLRIVRRRPQVLQQARWLRVVRPCSEEDAVGGRCPDECGVSVLEAWMTLADNGGQMDKY